MHDASRIKASHTCDAEHHTAELVPARVAIAQEESKPVVGPKGLEDVWPAGGDVSTTSFSISQHIQL